MKKFGTGAALLASILLLAACGSSKSSPSTASANPAASTTAQSSDPGSSDLTFDILGAPSADPYWAAIQKGALAAGHALGVNVHYLTVADPSNTSAAAYSSAITAAFSQKPSGVAIADFYPSTDDPMIKKEVNSGTPMVEYNQALPNWASNGVLAYVGQDETQGGVLAAKQMIADGIHNAICINHIPGTPTGEQRCGGFTSTMLKAGDKAKTITTPSSDQYSVSALTSDITGAIHSNPNAQAIMVLGVDVATAALDAKTSAGKANIKVATFDLSTAVLSDIKQHKVLFAVNSQPYLQGFDSIMSLYNDVRYGIPPVGQIETGPLLVTPGNVQKAITINAKYPGVLGAE
jgi:simple sugar transport system substrate-binding protein